MKINKKLRCGLDCDGVMTSFYLGFGRLIKELHGIDIPKEHPSKWNFCRDYITRKQEDLVWREIYKSRTFWRELPICPKLSLDDCYRIKKLCGTDEVFFITNTVSNDIEDAREQRMDWLFEQCGLERGSYNLILSDDKIEYINGIGLNLFVDDKPSFLNKVKKECPKTVVVRMNWEYNKEIDIIGVDNVSEYLDLVNTYKKIVTSLK